MAHKPKPGERGLWYFAHPYTGDEDSNFRLCNWRAAQFISLGYNIFSPISHSHPIQRAAPDLAGDIWYTLDDQIIAACAFVGIILAPGWEHSRGCRHERRLFQQRGLPILTYTEALHAWMEPLQKEQ